MTSIGVDNKAAFRLNSSGIHRPERPEANQPHSLYHNYVAFFENDVDSNFLQHCDQTLPGYCRTGSGNSSQGEKQSI